MSALPRHNQACGSVSQLGFSGRGEKTDPLEPTVHNSLTGPRMRRLKPGGLVQSATREAF